MPYIGLLQNGLTSIKKFIAKASENHYTAVAMPINANIAPYEALEFDPSYPDNMIDSQTWNNQVFLMYGDNVDCDSPNEKFREYSQQMMMRDKMWTEHLQGTSSTIVRLRKAHNVCLRALLMSKIKSNLCVLVPISNPVLATCEYEQDTSEETTMREQIEDTWNWWHNFHAGCNYNRRVKVVLELNANSRPSTEVVRRWLGEPIEAVVVPSTLFIRNRQNCAVLTKEWENIIACFLSVHVNLIVAASATDKALMQYADHLHKLIVDHNDIYPMLGNEDILEAPLQPLADNLDSCTYENLEKDPVKYKCYQQAVEQALLDRVPEEQACITLTVVMVLGAGRGPLVRAVFNAASRTKRKVRVYIIEKNPNVMRTLINVINELWQQEDVHIFSGDMRVVSPPELADILVSELMGSFGDNELSPECLDGALKLLKPDGISIPCKSTSYINPIMTTKIHNSLLQYEKENKLFMNYGYVILIKNIFHIAAPQPLFSFEHHNRSELINNQRYKIVQFKATNNCIMHGIAGYFDSVLYKDIMLSINPITHTPGVTSWFPMYFPLGPWPIKKGDDIEIHFWRKGDQRSVWYEWCLQKPYVSPQYNQDGIGYNMRLS